uniref:Uncharacterized protein n=1 Tax=Anguilla anguilla TaxID=7936 RepID=A0A0E9XPZ6_ANGAN
MSRTFFSVPLSTRSGLVRIARVLFPSGSTSCAIFKASVVAMSTLHGTTTNIMVSVFPIKFRMSCFI